MAGVLLTPPARLAPEAATVVPGEHAYNRILQFFTTEGAEDAEETNASS
jgi:hypothetical protein